MTDGVRRRAGHCWRSISLTYSGGWTLHLTRADGAVSPSVTLSLWRLTVALFRYGRMGVLVRGLLRVLLGRGYEICVGIDGRVVEGCSQSARKTRMHELPQWGRRAYTPSFATTESSTGHEAAHLKHAATWSLSANVAHPACVVCFVHRMLDLLRWFSLLRQGIGQPCVGSSRSVMLSRWLVMENRCGDM